MLAKIKYTGGVFKTLSKFLKFLKIANSFQPLTIFAKSYIRDFQLGSKYASTDYLEQQIKANISLIL